MIELIYYLNQQTQTKFRHSNTYIVTINTLKLFSLLVQIVVFGASFGLASPMVQVVSDESGLHIYLGCGEKDASDYTRVACDFWLQIIPNILNMIGGYSPALEGTSHQ